jgi:hypothetical protein
MVFVEKQSKKNSFTNDSLLFVKFELLLGLHLVAQRFMKLVCTPSSPFKFALLMLCLNSVSPLLGQSKSAYYPLTTAQNMAVSDTLAGQNLVVTEVSPIAAHGSVQIINITPGGNPATYQIQYTPTPGFVGTDTFVLELNYNTNYPFLIYRGYLVQVHPSVIKIGQDFASTPANTPVTIDVLANDTGSAGPFILTDITVQNNGTAVISNNQVVFTPTAGFTGTAHFNYTLLDAQNNVKNGSASIIVQNSAVPVNDTVQVLTAKNTALAMPLAFGGYTLLTAPTKGVLWLSPNGQHYRYTPNFNATGADEFVLTQIVAGTPVYKTVQIQILNAPTPNTMAQDDYIYTPRNQPITFNVRSNDIGDLEVLSWSIPGSFPGSITGTNGEGDVTFTPAQHFSGVAVFQYRIGNTNAPNLEVGTVYIIVNDLNPALTQYDLTTPVNTPLVVNYKIPFQMFSLTVTDAPEHGITDYWPGFSSQFINGNVVSGNNLLIYTPDQGFIGTDEMEVNYCVMGRCVTIKIPINVTPVVSSSAPYCVGDACVWPGDANTDGVINHHDLLPIAYHMGARGTARANASAEWYGQYAANWNDPFRHTVADLKHADTDGDGSITANDTLALSLFYGQYNDLTPRFPATSKGLPFLLNFLTPNPQIGDLVQIEISLGNAGVPVTNLHGFTWDARLSPLIVDSAFTMTYYPESWLQRNAPFLHLSRRPSQGVLQSAFARTGGISASGHGLIARADFIIVDIVNGARPQDKALPRSTSAANSPAIITISGEFMDGEGNLTSFSQDVEMPLVMPSASPNAPVQTKQTDLLVYPNPTRDLIEVHLNGLDLLEQITIVDLTGRQVWQSTDHLMVEHATIEADGWANGTYIVLARTQTAQVSRKIQVIR